MESRTTVHPSPRTPSSTAKGLSKTQKFTQLPIKNPEKPPKPDHVRIVCMSDTHCEHKVKFKIPKGDILIHAGDFTNRGHRTEFTKFNDWIKHLPYEHKIVISGNHDVHFDKEGCLDGGCEKNGVESVEDMRNLLADCTYLDNEAVTLYGLKIYGASWQPHGESLLSKWDLIPEDTDILVTHGPAAGHGDMALSGGKAGCVDLLSTIQNRVKPKYHIFGHMHDGYGISTDGSTTFINASTCNRNLAPINLPIVFDIKVKSKV